MKMGLLQLVLHHRERHSSSSVLGSENEFSVSLAGRGRHWEAAHLLERPQGSFRKHLRLSYPLEMGIGIAFRHYSLAGVMAASLHRLLLHWILCRRGLAPLGPCPCPLSLVLPLQMPQYLPRLRHVPTSSVEGLSAFVQTRISMGLLAGYAG